MQKRNEAWNGGGRKEEGEAWAWACCLSEMYSFGPIYYRVGCHKEKPRGSIIRTSFKEIWTKSRNINGERGLHQAPPNVSQFHPVRSANGLNIRIGMGAGWGLHCSLGHE